MLQLTASYSNNNPNASNQTTAIQISEHNVIKTKNNITHQVNSIFEQKAKIKLTMFLGSLCSKRYRQKINNGQKKKRQATT